MEIEVLLFYMIDILLYKIKIVFVNTIYIFSYYLILDSLRHIICDKIKKVFLVHLLKLPILAYWDH